MSMVHYRQPLPYCQPLYGSRINHPTKHWVLAFLAALASILLTAVLLDLASAVAQAQDSKRPSLVSIKIESSRPQPTAGAGLGITAEIKNLSDTKIYLRERSTTLSLPPEIDPTPGTGGYWATFPTESGDWDKGRNGEVALQPGETYKALWTLGRPSTLPKMVPSDFYYTFFPPGDYVISVVAKYWTGSESYHTATESATIHVTAPQLVILLGAAVGGLIAHFIFPQARRRLVTSTGPQSLRQIGRLSVRAGREISGIAAAVLVSTIVTILLSRISETQFLIRVTVNDFWGAIAIGFLANYAGSTVLANILGKMPGQRESKPVPQDLSKSN